MEIKKRLKEIAELLWANGYKGTICFDHKSYDDEDDIPRLRFGRKTFLVVMFNINSEGDRILIIDNNGKTCPMMTSDWSDDWSDSYCESIGLFALLREVYYETKESWEIGDYELNFINH